MTNPFSFGNMIKDPDLFVGRHAERETILARLHTAAPQGSAVVGPRRIGKSSLLYYLCHPRADDPLRPHPTLYLAYVDAQAAECSTPDGLRAAIVRAALGDWSPPPGRRSAETQLRVDLLGRQPCSWQDGRTALTDLPYHPVICLDELEACCREPFDGRFFGGLRHWSQDGLLTWLTGSALPPADLLPQHKIKDSPFNILATVALDGLSEAEAEALLDRAEQTEHAFTPAERRTIRAWAGSNPYHLQMVGFYWWQMKQRGAVDKNKLREQLCAQPAPPPAVCAPPRAGGPPWPTLIIIILLAVIAGLLAMLYRAVPAVKTQFDRVGSALGALWGALGALGDGVGGLVLVIALIIVVGGGIWQRRRLKEIAQELWQWIGGR